MRALQARGGDEQDQDVPKHVDFYFKNRFEKLIHLIGFIKGIYHDIRSPEHQIHCVI